MVCETKSPAHPNNCQCDAHRAERELTRVDGWEWIDDGRKTPIEPISFREGAGFVAAVLLTGALLSVFVWFVW